MEANEEVYEAFSRYGSGLTLVGVRDGDHDRFFIAASVMTASVDPFALAVSVGSGRDALPSMASGASWTLSVLATAHRGLVEELTRDSSREERLMALGAAGAEASSSGGLWLPDALAAFTCRTSSVTPVHDQTLVVGEVVDASLGTSSAPLLRWNRAFGTAGPLVSRSVTPG
ncbi:flavin reductase family protein [uncultured Agrococcus sp.]|uniref:flavin reductase family protein n=1 Tax=uncultured Agrococcus sp. TaxID=382258 RepID=UPI0025DFB3E3|nr:flavin reductase family protein [uncultured Agrococcus sp.]